MKKLAEQWMGLLILSLCLTSQAQTAPTITTQPASQTNLAGSNVTFTVAVAGTGPFTYQWQFNGNNLPTNIITTVAGTGSNGFFGDGGPATNAGLASPYGIALDASGNLYFADSGDQRIRKVGTNGIITTVAGNGGTGFSGDGGAATKAGLNSPWGVALDGVGNVYFADEVNQRIRKVGTNGIITTVAGNGYEGFYGNGGAASDAELNFPQGVALDGSGNLYLGDFYNRRVRKVDANDIITTVAGNGLIGSSCEGIPATNAMLYQPSGVAVDSSGNLYIADAYFNNIRKVDTNGIITTVAGNGWEAYLGDGGTAKSASLANPYDLVLDDAGNMYIADTYNNRIRKVDTNGIITTVAGSGYETYAGDGGEATNASLSNPFGVAVDASGNVFIADTGNNRIREVHPGGYPILPLNAIGTNKSGNYTVVITSPYGSVTSAVASLTVVQPPAIVFQSGPSAALPGSNATLGVTVAGTPPFYYSWYFNATNLVQNGASASFVVSNMSSSNTGQYMVVVTNAYGSATSLVAALAVAFPPSLTTQPVSQTNLAGSSVIFDVAVNGTGPFFYQWQFNGTNLPYNVIATVAGGGSGGDGGAATNASLCSPSATAFDALGNLYIADPGNDRIRKVDTNGTITTVAGNGNEDYSGDGVPATNTSLYSPLGVALDTLGNLYIADSANERIRKVDTSGIITTLAGNELNGYVGSYSGDGGPATNANLNTPSGVAVDAFGGLYIADAGNNRIRKIDTSGTITTFAGNGSAAFSGDGGAATNAGLDYPVGVAFDGAGSLFIADIGNQCIRKVNTNGIITTVAGGGSGGLGGAATNANLQAPYANANSPLGVALDALGNLYISDGNLQRVLKVDTNGIITSVAGNGTGNGYSGDGGAATNAGLNEPGGVALDSLGNLYVADTGDQLVREVHFAGLPVLQLPNVSTNNTGNYAVIVTSPYGSVTSTVAALTVNLPPCILVQPASQGVMPGSNAILSVTAAGTPSCNYLWYFNATNLVQNGTNASLILTNASSTNTGQYLVVVTNAYGSVTSQVAIVALPPSLTAQPVSQTALPGTNVAFGMTVSGVGPFTYQWQFNGSNLPNGIITTVAGNGTAACAGDGGAATSASLNNPQCVAFDNFGNLFIADTANSRIRKVSPNGIISTVAGTNSGGYSGDGGMATNAQLSSPCGIVLDAAGNLYIADSANNRIRKVGTDGIITTEAGTNSAGFSGDGGPATNAELYDPTALALDSAGNLYIADNDNGRVRKMDANGIISTVAGDGLNYYSGEGGQATEANLTTTSGIVLDASGNLYIADAYDNRVCEVGTNGIITTVAGVGPNYPYDGALAGDGGPATNAGLFFPYGLSLDAGGNLYIADMDDECIRMVDTSGVITTIAGNGGATYFGDGCPATNASLLLPNGLAMDAPGNLYIADTHSERIRKVLLYAVHPTLTLLNVGATNAGNYAVVITSPYGSSTSAVATLTVEAPPVVTVQPANELAVAGNNASLAVTVAGSGPFGYLWYLAGTNLLQSSASSTISLPGVSSNNAGSYTVVITNAYGSVTSAVANLTVVYPPSVTAQPASQTILAGGNVTFTVSAGGAGPLSYQWQLDGTNIPDMIPTNTFFPIVTVAGNGTNGFSGDGGQATNAELRGPNAAMVDAFGNIFIADWYNNRVRKVSTNGVIATVAGNGYTSTPVNGSAATNTGFSSPAFVIADPAGNLFISVNGANRIVRVGTNGILTIVAGVGSGFSGDGGQAASARLNSPFGIALDASGDLFFADTGNNRIRKVGTNGIITTVAGTNGAGFTGDGGPATSAKLYQPRGVFVDSVGNLYISDTCNSRVRVVGTNGIITTVAGNGIQSYPGYGTFAGDGGMAANAGLSHPDAVALDPFGNLFIADAYNNRIRQVAPNGIITTLAGGGTNGLGDGGSAAGASLSNPSCVAVDASGNIFIDDNNDCRIREVVCSSPILFLTNVSTNNAGNYTVVVTSPYGCVTSAVAKLTVATAAPQIVTGDGVFGFATNQFGFNVGAAAGETIVVDGSTDLVNWTPICTNTLNGSSGYVCDPCWTNYPRRFYRARLQ